MTIPAVVMKMINDLTPNEIYDATGKTVEAFRKVSMPESPVNLHFQDAMSLDALLMMKGEDPVFLPFYQAWLKTNMKANHANTTSLESRIVASVADLGKVSCAVIEAQKDGNIDLQEMREIHQQAAAALEKITALVNATDPKNRAIPIKTGMAS